MSTSIDQAFIKQFEREVHEAYQRQGSKLLNAVRRITNVKGSSTTFQKVGKGTADTKSRHGLVPVMNASHSSVECILTDYYAGDWVDKLDELKVSHDERGVVANAGAYALGRKTDDLIITALQSTTTEIADGNTGMTLAKVMTAFETLGSADVPDDGQRFAVVGYKQWSELLQIDEFSSSDYVGPDELPFKGVQAKKWLGTIWMPHSGLPVASDIRSCFWFHKTAIGHASGSDVQSDVTWHGDRAAHFVNNMMSQGAVLIDTTGVVEIKCDETPD
ncbi:MAG: hypothetical protein E6R03_10570 [Hyphomicrobiaceae bacterium]|nr:MAG: hypothetical protein E6R03_10570 [Hyphomicrobiaceae bacterium]